MRYDILLLILGTVLCLIFVAAHQPQKDTIFLCTTYFDCPKRDSWAMFQNGMDRLQSIHDKQTLSRIDKWVVINEYCLKPRANWAKLMAQKYPFITFLQKGERDQGHVKSLNIILPYITPYKYWFHWEEGWVPSRSFLARSFQIMDDSRITQLQLTSNENEKINWMTRSEKKSCGADYCIIEHSNQIDENLGESKIKTFDQLVQYWPLYSLQPSINRVSFYTFGNFSERKFPYPLVAEYDFAERWYRRGGVKAVYKNGPLKRPKNYISTHD